MICLPVLLPQFYLLWEPFDLSLGACVRDTTKLKKITLYTSLSFPISKTCLLSRGHQDNRIESLGFAVQQTWVQIPVLPPTVPLGTLFNFSGLVFSAVNSGCIVGT